MARIRVMSVICFLGWFTLCLSAGANLHLSSQTESVPDEYMVALRSGTTIDDVKKEEAAIAKIPEIRIIRSYTIGRRSFFRIQARTDHIALLSQHLSIDFIEANQILHLVHPVVSRPRRVASPAEANQEAQPRHPACQLDYDVGAEGWGLVRTSYRSKPNYETDPYVYGEGDDGTGVDIYVLDTGIRLDHEDFQGRASWGMTGDNITNTDETDMRGHGSHVAGIAGGSKFGVARKANLIACKVLNDNGVGVTSDVVQAVEFVVNRTKSQRAEGKVPRSIINMSFSGTGLSYTSETVLQEAAEEGVLSVAAAGNAGSDTCLQTPARVAAIITVSASDINDTMPIWSNYGPCSDLIAPGVDITAPDASTINKYSVKSGTSMAAPHVTGVVARYLSVLSDTEVSTTSTDMIKAVITDMATRHHVDLASIEQQASPDRLLYKVCESPHGEQSSDGSSTDSVTTTTTSHTTSTPTTTMGTTTTAQPPTTPLPTTWTHDNIGDMSLAALVILAIILCCCLDVIILLYCSISKM